jgi:hypothetical protein
VSRRGSIPTAVHSIARPRFPTPMADRKWRAECPNCGRPMATMFYRKGKGLKRHWYAYYCPKDKSIVLFGPKT